MTEEATTVLEDVDAPRTDEPQIEGAKTTAEIARQSRSMVPFGAMGVDPKQWEQAVVFGQSMTKARYSLPAHLQGNIGDCLAVINISVRACLDPYAVGAKTYVQNGRLCYESQLAHALLRPHLSKRLTVKYEGEGDDLVCIVTGRAKGDIVDQVHKSPPLKKVHPGYSLKQGDAKYGKKISRSDGQKMIAEADGSLVPGLFVNGSPLWDKKPEMQLYYNTSFDWGRKFCPEALMGFVDVDEAMQHEGDGEMHDVTPLADRLASGRVETGEGFREGHAERELAAVAAEVDVDLDAKDIPRRTAPGPEETARIKTEAAINRAGKRRTPAKPPTKAQVRAVADRAEDRAAEKAKATAKSNGIPTDARSYMEVTTIWIENAVDPVASQKRWADEYDLRHECRVPVKSRIALKDALEAKVVALGGKVVE